MAADLQLPPGFRFHPTDNELVMHYLCQKCASQPLAVPIIGEIDLYKYNPWDLPDLALYGEKEWFFFSPRDRKYPNGSRPNRAAGSGYWKATGADKPIGQPKTMGIKKALVFYSGKAPKGEKTNWIMHEYRLADVDRSARKNKSLRLDDWVLCRIYNKKGTNQRQPSPEKKPSLSGITEEEEEKKPEIAPRGIDASATLHSVPATCNYNFDPPETILNMHYESSCSEQVLSPEFTTSEVQSEPKWNNQNQNALDFAYNYFDASTDMFQIGSQMSPLQDMFMYLQKPF